ncbi:murein hydrolase activator EnvC family protein [Pseudofulvimonas gallinarii]|uniref:Septal ring factor EnvC (AmiA/AmiB activator) n=1 Tax=Pseudofulvimonas gallinarii TaxID=634155 RepID=A0A4S3KYF8_9GAMM|nr:peptidoglycan DD-metalloendopeptidase family protein [Pseudofulvimonas gallinarii]TCS98837.1 septal ring factor EnvC (AmiA/AmiB activator) [Pseudofulvimonas gallinarii]THD14320.1 hypothetical protein B1808_03400 [Pseudofulvimonas gallinarii]
MPPAGAIRALLCGLALCAGVAAAEDVPVDPVQRGRQARQTEAELGRIRTELAGLKQRLEEGQRRESNVVAELADAERAVSAHRQRLAELDAERSGHEETLQRVASERARVEADIETQRLALAGVLRLLYARSRQAPMKLLLDPERMPRMARTLGYGRALQRAHLRRIGEFTASLKALAGLAARREAELAALAEVRARASDIEAELVAAVAERERLLDAVRLELASHRQQAGALERDERRLVRLLEQLRDIFADLPKVLEGAQPFRSQRGHLPWPADGAVRATDQGGLLIAAEAGSPVRAVAHGRVAFADWLKGYGLLLIVDHGDGYMTLYGHNDSLLKAEGAWVQGGEVIARVGRSGGEAQAGLFFGVRERGRSIEARPWLRRR